MAKVALLVGVSEYEPGLNPLPGSVQDVDAMQRVLAHPELGGFAETDITVLKNPQRQAMEDAIYWLFSDRKKDDLLLFYFSGHGIKDESGRLYLATRATRKDNNGRLVKPSAVSAAALHESINESRSQRQVMILDCCFSGAIAQGMTVKDDSTVNLKEYLGGKGRAILTSSTSTEYSFGSDAAGQGDVGLSIYTRYLVEGIEKGSADTDGDGWIAVEELHEYAANRVKEAAPAMTPKFYPVEEGYKIVLARSPKDDPKLKYRKEAQVRAEQGQGQFSIIAQRLLAGKQIEWGISAEEAKAIEDEVLQPYREYTLKQQEYEQALAEVVQTEYPLSATAEAELKEYQQHLGLRDSDIAAIEARILQPLREQFTQQSAAYQQNLVQYEQALTDAIQQEFPFSLQGRQGLKKLQQSLGLRDEDIAHIEQPLIQQAELRHQEKLRQEVERQQQEKKRAEYRNKLRRYEQEFTKAIQSEYPLNQFVVERLKTFQQQLGLKRQDVTQIEQPLITLKEAEFQNQLNVEQNQQEETKNLRQEELKSRYIDTLKENNETKELKASIIDKTAIIHANPLVDGSSPVIMLTDSKGSVLSVAVSPDNKTIASGSGKLFSFGLFNDNTVRLWDISTKKILYSLSGHSGRVISVAFSPDGKILASGSTDRTIMLWRVADGKVLDVLDLSDEISAIVLSPDGQLLIAGGHGSYAIKVCTVSGGKLLQTLSGHSDMIRSIAISPDGQFIASGSRDSSIKIWRINDGKELYTLSGHPSGLLGGVTSVAISPNGHFLASCGHDLSVRLWQLSNGKELQEIKDSVCITSVTFSRDGQFLVSGNTDGYIRLFQVSGGHEVQAFSGHSGEITSLNFSIDGNFLISSSDDKSIKFWRVI